MAKFSAQPARPNVHAPVVTTTPTVTHEGGQGWGRDPKSELFLLAITNLVSERTFYEDGKTRDDRYETLVQTVTAQDPEWVQRFIPWLRNTAQMRSASLVAAAEYVKAGGPNGRQVVASALQRADEPAEMLGYWSQRHGKRFPMPVKRGVADAVTRLYTERSALKYDGQSRAWRMADVLELVHAKPTTDEQSRLFRWLLDRRHNRPTETTGLAIIDRAAMLTALPEDQRRGVLREQGPATLDEAGFTWERLSGWLPGGMDAEAWEAIIPSMGYMAMLRNLRNFDQAGVSTEVAASVIARLTDPEQVARSRQFPIRFFSAYKHVESERWKPALEQAVNLSMQNVPPLTGKTCILVDVSGSMMGGYWGERTTVAPWETAGLFAAALATRAEHADLYAYSTTHSPIDYGRGASVFTVLNRIQQSPAFGGGTNTIQTIAQTFAGHDRVIVLTDEQAFGAGGYHGVVDTIPLIYTFNLAGYSAGHQPSGQRGRYTFGGLTDAGFRLIGILENMRDTDWPF